MLSNTTSRPTRVLSDADVALIRYINMKLAALGQPVSQATAEPQFLEFAEPLLRNHQQKNQLLSDRLCPVDSRIQAFLDRSLRDVCPNGAPKLPAITFLLDRPGQARAMSLPASGDTFVSPYVSSYRIRQGVLHNPKKDRRTTKGIFHITEGGLPIPDDKIGVPRAVFAAMLAQALQPPDDVLTLPFTSDQEHQAKLFVSLLQRPLVCPATGTDPAKTMEVRFFAPGSLVSNLDFVEGTFGNAGDPYLPENDAALDVMHWTGHTGCVILAPHLTGVRKKDAGLPHIDQATERQRRDGMCWQDEEELYNEGEAFKLTCRDESGVIVTLIADNYYGYCKKEVKTQISFAANLFGRCEEEHAGGAIAFPSYILGQDFYGGRTVRLKEASFAESLKLLEGMVDIQPEGHAVDRNYPTVFYVPENSIFSVREGTVVWEIEGQKRQIVLRHGYTYVMPAGYRIRLEKQFGGTQWRLTGTRPDGTVCHKPCTVSGGGKSEISKSIANAILKGPVFVNDYTRDVEVVAEILRRDYSNIFRNPTDPDRAKRPILSPDRSLGSVIKLLTPSAEYTDDYNGWLRGLPQYIRQLVCTVKRYYRQDWDENLREHFTVDRINGALGHELKFDNEKLVGNYLRVGFDTDGSWRIYKLRPDFYPADKVQLEDDITASVVVPRDSLSGVGAEYTNPSLKLVQNCERFLFQRPDEAIFRGFDKQAEADLATPGTFISNFEPLSRESAREIVDHVVEFDKYTEPMKQMLLGFVHQPGTEWVVSSSHPRIVDGAPSKNPRYLQLRPDLASPQEAYLAGVCTRLYQQVPATKPVHQPVHAVLAGRRGNPPDLKAGIPPLAVYNPIHYLELPELFMDWVSSLTGKSPSTTGFGSEGALTKRPFNALPPVVDLNNALVSAILTGYAGFSTAAGYVGPHYRVDHDISMLVPEIWCRMRVSERDPAFLTASGYLEKIEDYEYKGRKVLASRLGYRITETFVDRFLGRIFETPNVVLPAEFLKPELQDADSFAAGVDAIVESQRRVAQEYFDDGSVDLACPPLRALLHLMAHGSYEGRTVEDPAWRSMFTRESLMQSDWYQERLRAQRQLDMRLWQRHVDSLTRFKQTATPVSLASIDLEGRLAFAKNRLAQVSGSGYLAELSGTLGADPFQLRPRLA